MRFIDNFWQIRLLWRLLEYRHEITGVGYVNKMRFWSLGKTNTWSICCFLLLYQVKSDFRIRILRNNCEHIPSIEWSSRYCPFREQEKYSIPPSIATLLIKYAMICMLVFYLCVRISHTIYICKKPELSLSQYGHIFFLNGSQKGHFIVKMTVYFRLFALLNLSTWLFEDL